MRKPEEFKKQAELKGITYWPSHDCSICGESVGTDCNRGKGAMFHNYGIKKPDNIY